MVLHTLKLSGRIASKQPNARPMSKQVMTKGEQIALDAAMLDDCCVTGCRMTTKDCT